MRKGLFALAAFAMVMATSSVYADQPQIGTNHDVGYALATIRSNSDLNNYLAATAPGLSPLDKLSPQGKQHFLMSLSFNEKGLTGFDYTDLQRELTPSQIYKVLALFGAQHVTTLVHSSNITSNLDTAVVTPDNTNMPGAGDHDDYRCAEKGSCESWPGYICTSNC